MFGHKVDKLGRKGRDEMVCGPSSLRIKCAWYGRGEDSGDRNRIPLFQC